jgi:hypothetical protein
MDSGIIVRTGYFDPNTYGARGYSFIGPLLLFYDKVVLYGPVSAFVEQSYYSEKFNKTSLTPTEFERAIIKGEIIPAGFESFFDSGKRQEFLKQELRITTQFDKDLLNRSSPLGRKAVRVPNNFKLELSAKTAKQLLVPFLKS